MCVQVGYPNVGKSSTINALIQTKKVPVSATPGRTKHFQVSFILSMLLKYTVGSCLSELLSTEHHIC